MSLDLTWIKNLISRILILQLTKLIILKVVDMGCGDGAIGEAMMKKGFRDIVGVDISQSMLNIAESKGCYNSIKKADLLKPLPFNDNHFDVLVTAGVTTYLGL